MLRHREDVIPVGLSVPARHAGEAVSNIFDLDVERRRIEEIEPAARPPPFPPFPPPLAGDGSAGGGAGGGWEGGTSSADAVVRRGFVTTSRATVRASLPSRPQDSQEVARPLPF